MMNNFIASNPTQLHFGQGVVSQLGKVASKYGTKVLLIYGQGSVVRHGYYDTVKQNLLAANCTIVEYKGIRPNPITDDADKAIALGIETKADMVIALGGGSVIDTAKIVNAITKVV